DGGNQVNQFTQLTLRQLRTAIALVQNPLQLGVLSFDGSECIVDALANIRLLCSGAQRFPACRFRHPEHVGGGVVVAVFQFCCQVVFAGIREVIFVSRSAKRLSSSARRAEKVSEMYFRKMSPRTRCLYSAASMLARSLSAAAHSVRLMSSIMSRGRSP